MDQQSSDSYSSIVCIYKSIPIKVITWKNATSDNGPSSTQSEVSTYTEKPLEKTPTLRPYKDRFKFIYKNSVLKLDGPVVNPIPSSVTWHQDLAHVEVCNASSPFMLAIVPSAIQNKRRREVIRRTWASPSLFNRLGMRTLFIVGATLDQKLQADVEDEATNYNDIIQYNFIDSYQNLTYKTISWLTWVNQRCPQVPFVIKIDDDVIFNPFHLRQYLDQQLLSPVEPKIRQSTESSLPRVQSALRHPATRCIYGYVQLRSWPHREGKWAVSKEEYPEPIYPPFTLGPAYIVGGNAVGRLLQYASYVPLLKLEDVYTTGLVARAARVKQVQAQHLYTIGGRVFNLHLATLSFWTEHGDSDKSYTWQKILSHSMIR
ncbi:beta-1,3-galactosyltransferase 5-like isoform X2 [Palaemon carinicauda]